MKQTTVQIRFDAERYSALLRYAAKKNISIEKELLDCLEKQYKKIVPPDVREYIENKDEPLGKKNSEEKKEMPQGVPAVQSFSEGDAEQNIEEYHQQ